KPSPSYSLPEAGDFAPCRANPSVQASRRAEPSVAVRAIPNHRHSVPDLLRQINRTVIAHGIQEVTVTAPAFAQVPASRFDFCFSHGVLLVPMGERMLDREHAFCALYRPRSS